MAGADEDLSFYQEVVRVGGEIKGTWPLDLDCPRSSAGRCSNVMGTPKQLSPSRAMSVENDQLFAIVWPAGLGVRGSAAHNPCYFFVLCSLILEWGAEYLIECCLFLSAQMALLLSVMSLLEACILVL